MRWFHSRLLLRLVTHTFGLLCCSLATRALRLEQGMGSLCCRCFIVCDQLVTTLETEVPLCFYPFFCYHPLEAEIIDVHLSSLRFDLACKKKKKSYCYKIL